MGNDKMKWELCSGTVKDDAIRKVEQMLQMRLPLEFVQIVKECNGGCPERSSFIYIDPETNRKVGAGFGALINFDVNEEDNIMDFLNEPPEGFPKYLVPFAEPGNGDYICFDYSGEKKGRNPRIVMWLHENREDSNTVQLANDFGAFMETLTRPVEL